MPEDCDCVVMQENVTRNDETINVKLWPKHKENIRNIGDDTKQGQLLFPKGSALSAANVGLLASCGVADVAVFKPITVGFFSTGNELAPVGSHLKLGQIYDSNRYTLHALLEQAGVTAVDMGVIADNPASVEAALVAASKQCDVIITTGGVSVGEADFITDILDKIGTVNLWKIAIKPGKPLVFGHINNARFFGLPGNPVSVMVTFQQVVLPALKKLMGYETVAPTLTLRAIAAETIIKQPGRMEFQRGFAKNINGDIIVTSTGEQGSHILSSMSKANCFIVLEQNTGNIEKGQTINIQLFGNSL
jgi:molybdopterin molybdotransferase